MNELLRPGERLDPLNRNNYTIIQNPAKFCFGMDAVLLSGFAAVKEGETAVDLGAGNGIISILLAAKTPGKHFTGLEIQADNVDMAMRSIKINQLEDRITMLQGDIKQASDIFGKASFDVPLMMLPARPLPFFAPAADFILFTAPSGLPSLSARLPRTSWSLKG